MAGKFTLANATSHLEKLKASYPYGLLGDDHGILTVDDLALNACIADPQPVSDEIGAYPYWQCFESENVRVECDHGGEQEPGTPVQALFALVIRIPPHKIEYIAHGIMDLSSCREYEKHWRRLTKGEKHACISGPLIRFDQDKDREYDAHWVFDKFKTRKGCVSYFEGHCDIRHKRSPCAGNTDK
jgi:hypothetical protein